MRLIAQLRLLSHCSIFSGVHELSLRMFSEFPVDNHANHKLFIYGGEVLPSLEIDDLQSRFSIPGGEAVVPVHQSNVDALLEAFREL